MSETHRIRDNISVIEWMKEIQSTYSNVTFMYDEVEGGIVALDKIYEEVGIWSPAIGGLGYGSMLCPPHPSTWSAEYVRAIAHIELSDKWSIHECTYLGEDDKGCHQFIMKIYISGTSGDRGKYTLKQISIDSSSDVHVTTPLIAVGFEQIIAFNYGVKLGRTLTNTDTVDE